MWWLVLRGAQGSGSRGEDVGEGFKGGLVKEDPS